MRRIGFIGLGTMGQHMARHLVRAGHAVRAYDQNPAALAGFDAADGIADAADGADLVILMLPDTPDVEAVIEGPGGLRAHPPPGRLTIDMSTISPAATRRMAAALADAGVALLDAPVSGGPQGAEAGTLTVMCGGTDAAFATARPVLEAMGTTVTHCGPAGAGQTVKLCNQLVCALNIQAICEAFALGRAAGIDPAMVRDVLRGGAAQSWMLETLGPKIIGKDASAGFRIDLKLKDLRLANELAHGAGVPLPGLALATSLYLEARAHGEGSNGNQALFRTYDRMTNQQEEPR